MKLSELLTGISYRLVGNPSCSAFAREIEQVTADHRKAHAGALYVCTRTALRDGHQLAYAAYSAGCRAFLAERELTLPEDAVLLLVADAEALLGELAGRCLGYPARHMTIFGIVGAVGKSAVAHTVTALLRRAGLMVASMTTDGITLGKEVRPAGSVVPDAGEIQEFLRECADKGIAFAVLELSSYILAHKGAFSIPFAALLLTDPSGSDACEVQELFKDIPLVGDVPFVIAPTHVGQIFGVGRQLTFGEGGDFYARMPKSMASQKGFGTGFELCLGEQESVAVSLSVPGDFAVRNALAAAALATVAGFSLAEIGAGLSTVVPVGRLECIGACAGRHIYADVAYSGKALARALEVLRARTEGKLTVLLGSVGGRARERRAVLGKAAAEHADFVYLTADDPDCEDPRIICEEMAAGIEDPYCYCIIPDRRKAIQRAVLELRPGDTLLLAGKGGEPYQLVCGYKEAFSEKEIVKEAIKRF